MKEKMLKSVLHGFLGTYSSRYSDFDGYWLFCLILEELNGTKINLLNKVSDKPNSQHKEEAARLASMKFQEQLQKHGMQPENVRNAELCFETLPGTKEGFVNGKLSNGREVCFQVAVISEHGKQFTATETVFIAPHDSHKELRSVRRLAGG